MTRRGLILPHFPMEKNAFDLSIPLLEVENGTVPTRSALGRIRQTRFLLWKQHQLWWTTPMTHLFPKRMEMTPCWLTPLQQHTLTIHWNAELVRRHMAASTQSQVFHIHVHQQQKWLQLNSPITTVFSKLQLRAMQRRSTRHTERRPCSTIPIRIRVMLKQVGSHTVQMTNSGSV